MPKSAAAQLRILRGQIELVMEQGSLILVTSARANDGSTIAANGLAEGLAASGHRVAFIDGTLPTNRADAERPRMSRYRIAELAAAGSRPNDAVATLVDKMRREYDFTIVDAPQLIESTTAMLLASVAEGVLLSVQLDRARCGEDESMMAALELAQARVLGVIASTQAAIAEFEREAKALVAGDRVTRLKRSWTTAGPVAAEQ